MMTGVLEGTDDDTGKVHGSANQWGQEAGDKTVDVCSMSGSAARPFTRGRASTAALRSRQPDIQWRCDDENNKEEATGGQLRQA